MGVEARSFSVTKALLSTAGSSHIKAIADGVNEADLAAWLRGHSSGTENSEVGEGRKQPARKLGCHLPEGLFTPGAARG